MALNLSTLTSPATSGDVLAEALTTADFLEPVPVLRNLARGSNKGGDAEQAVALNQPKALPLIDGEGYLYLPDVSGNYASVPDESALDVTSAITLECDFILNEFPLSNEKVLLSKFDAGTNDRGYRLSLAFSNKVRFVISTDGSYNSSYDITQDFSSVLTGKTRATVKVNWRQSDGRTQFFIKESDGSFTQVGSDKTSATTSIYNTSQPVVMGRGRNIGIFGARIYASVDGTDKRLDVDFTAPNVRHGATKFKCATGQVVTINQSGNNPATVIKKPVLRFDGVNDGLKGLLGQTVTGGYFFAAYSVVGGGGQNFGRVASLNSTGETDTSINYAILAMRGGAAPATGTRSIINGIGQLDHDGMFSDDVKDVLFELKFTASNAVSKINNSNTQSVSGASTVDAEEFNVGANATGSNAGAIDLEYLALFPASITDAQADAVRNYINNRNNVFYRWDTDGYYFFDPQKATFTGNFTDVNTLDGYITGSDLGDTDVRTNLTLEQATLNDQPSTDGYKITFNDSAEHLEFDNAASQTLAGWQIVGTSLGTFVYLVDSDAVTELNLLGNAGFIRKAGDLYGIILLPESATGREINEAKKLLTDRGASVSATGTVTSAWRNRNDIVQFDGDMSGVTGAYRAWKFCQSLTSFNTPLPSATDVTEAWMGCSSLTSFSTELPLATDVSYAWRDCSALTSFPAGAKLGTEANNVNFTSAWQSSGLTSFSTPLPTATRLFRTWQNTALTSFSSDISSATNAFAAWRVCTSLTSFDTALPLVTDLRFAFDGCSSLPSFDVSIPVAITMDSTWLNCSSLTDFSADVFSNWNPSSINSGVFNDTWTNCTSLTAQSVENILTSIDASNQHGTDDGTSTGNPLGDSGIDIDYNGDPLSAATTAAIDSLSGKGWQVFINGELVIPNILDLEPAAAYSLRSFDADADPNVVNVRRSSDGATSDFTASEVSDGTLTSWVNTEYNHYTSDFSSGVDGWSSYAGTTTPNVDSIGGRDDCLRFVTNGTDDYHFIFDTQQLLTDNRYRISAEVYLPSSNTQIDEVKVLNGLGDFVNIDGSNSITSTGEWVTVSFEATRNSGTNGHRVDFIAYTNVNNIYEGNGTDTFYVRNIQIDQLTADGHVTTWYDQSDNGNDSTQSTASAQPKIVDGGTLVTEGGLAAVDFDGSDDSLSYSGNVFGTATSAMFIVNSFDVANPTKRDVIAGGQDTVDTRYDFVIARQYGGGMQPYIEGFGFSGAVSTTDTNAHLYSLTHNAGTSTGAFGRDGVTTSTPSSSASVTSATDFVIGKDISSTSNSLNGQIQEIVVFNTDQSTNRTGIENNINDHFDIYS